MGWTDYTEVVHHFVANPHSLVHSPGRQIDWDLVTDQYAAGQVTVTTTAAEGIGSTELAVTALSGPIPAGAMLYFGETGEYARVTTAAAAGDTTIAVEATLAAIESGDSAYYNSGARGKVIPAGTIMAELASGKIVPRALSGADTATHILESSAQSEDDVAHVGVGVLRGGVIFENVLPDFDHASFATWQGELEAAGVGAGWVWETYADNTAS